MDAKQKVILALPIWRDYDRSLQKYWTSGQSFESITLPLRAINEDGTSAWADWEYKNIGDVALRVFVGDYGCEFSVLGHDIYLADEPSLKRILKHVTAFNKKIAKAVQADRAAFDAQPIDAQLRIVLKAIGIKSAWFPEVDQRVDLAVGFARISDTLAKLEGIRLRGREKYAA